MNTVKIETPVSAPRWSEDLAEKVIWLTHRNENRAELVLTPATLGRIEVTVTQSPNGDTSVMFVAASTQARDALEQSLPRLREILGDAGISLGQTGVNAESSPRNGSSDTASRQPRSQIESLADGAIAAVSARPRYGLGMVDTFA
ncbi:MAG: flagellar hook-length control protein FliK [Rhodocyclaceae bacterium]